MARCRFFPKRPRGRRDLRRALSVDLVIFVETLRRRLLNRMECGSIVPIADTREEPRAILPSAPTGTPKPQTFAAAIKVGQVFPLFRIVCALPEL